MKKKYFFLAIIFSLVFISCITTAYTDSAVINNNIPIPLKEYQFKISLDNPHASLYIDGVSMKETSLKLPEGKHILKVTGSNIKKKEIELFVNKDTSLALKTDPPESKLTHLKTMYVGSLPKGMEFTRDGKYLFIALLGKPSVVLLDGENMEFIKEISHANEPYSKSSFVEIGISPVDDYVFASQMTTGSIHKIQLTGEKAFEITDTISTHGIWSKVITFSEKGNLLAVSNWSSQDVTFFSYPDLTYLNKVSVPGIPRGMVFTDDDQTLYVSNYSNGNLHKIDLNTWKIDHTIRPQKSGALRHLVIDREKNVLYASDMGEECIYVYDLNNKAIIKKIRVDYNPNTIALSPDNKYLFVSCRGPNAKSSYLDRSPRSGKLYMIDCSTLEIADIRVLGNQPTALAVHPSGEFLAVSNFRDKNIEVYKIDQPLPPLPQVSDLAEFQIKKE